MPRWSCRSLWRHRQFCLTFESLESDPGAIVVPGQLVDHGGMIVFSFGTTPPADLDEFVLRMATGAIQISGADRVSRPTLDSVEPRLTKVDRACTRRSSLWAPASNVVA